MESEAVSDTQPIREQVPANSPKPSEESISKEQPAKNEEIRDEETAQNIDLLA